MKNSAGSSPPFSIPQTEPDLGDLEAKALHDYILAGGWATEHERTRLLEKRVASFVGAAECVFLTSGTTALAASLMASGISPGDEVLVPDLTMIATANAAVLSGAKPIFIDVEPGTLCLDLSYVEKALERSPRAKAVIHVSLNGRSNDVPALNELCRQKNTTLIEDAAQSFASRHQGRYLGTFGAAGVYSFSPHKIITTGQGGAVVTDNVELANRVRKLKDFGRLGGGTDIHDTIGYNFKFTDIQATLGLCQMDRLSDRIARKKAVFRLYRHLLEDVAQVEFLETDLNDVCPWFVDVYVSDRDRLSARLRSMGIGTRPLYPPLHRQNAYAEFSHLVFPNSEKSSASGLWLPSSTRLTDDQITSICDEIHRHYKKSPRPKLSPSSAEAVAPPVRLHLGCGKRHMPGFIHIDQTPFPHLDHVHAISLLPMFSDDSVDLIYNSHSLEYFDPQEAGSVLKEWRRVLKPGGLLRLAVPDWEALLRVYEARHDINSILGPLYGRMVAGDPPKPTYHKTVYDFSSLKKTLEAAGYESIRKYNWRDTDHRDYDDFSRAHTAGVLISLNVEASKPQKHGDAV